MPLSIIPSLGTLAGDGFVLTGVCDVGDIRALLVVK